jgi:tetratricopeptide (TPR) repeat protein
LQPASQKLDFEPPGSGIALQEVVQMLRRFLGLKETRIVGEITCMTTECKPEGLALRLRVFHSDGMKSDPMKIIPVSLNGDQTNEAEIDRNPFGDGMKIIFLDPISDQTNEAEIDRYFHAAAIELLRELDPYVVAFYLYQTNKDAAEHEALQLLIDPTHPDRKWALNLLGFIAADSWNYDRAIYWYLRALEENEEDKFAAIAYTNWGNALGAKGDPDGAIKKFTRATELDPNNAFAYNSWGLVLVKKVELAKAEAELAKGKDEWAEAIKNFMRATKLDPEYADAYSNWGNALAAKGDLDEAIKKFTLATELDPENAVAYSSLGRALRDKDKWAEAIEKFTLATKLDPKYAAAILDIAFELSKLSSTADSAEAFQRYARYAADAYERYLDLVPDTPIVGYIRDEINILRSDATNN